MKEVIIKFHGEEVIVMGDVNSPIGILGEEVNRNGSSLQDFMEETHLVNHMRVKEGR